MNYLRLLLAALLVLWGPSAALGGTNFLRGTFEARDTATGTAGTGPKLDGDNARIDGPNDLDLKIRLDPDNDSVQQLIIEAGDGTDAHTFTEAGALTITGLFQCTDATFTGGDLTGANGISLDLGEADANEIQLGGSLDEIQWNTVGIISTLNLNNALDPPWLYIVNSGGGGTASLNVENDVIVGDDLTVTDVANLNGAVNIGDAVGDAITMTGTVQGMTIKDAAILDAFVTGADSSISFINSGVSGGTRVTFVKTDGGWVITGTGGTAGVAGRNRVFSSSTAGELIEYYMSASAAANINVYKASGNTTLTVDNNGTGDCNLAVTGAFVSGTQSQGDVAGPGTIALTQNQIVFTGLTGAGAVGYITGGSGTQIITLINTDAEDAVVMHTKEGAGAGHLHLGAADVTLNVGDTMMLVHRGSTDAWNLLSTSDNTE